MRRRSRSTCEYLTFDSTKILFRLNTRKTQNLESTQNANEEVVKFLVIQHSQTLYFLGQDAPNSFHYLQPLPS